MNLILGGGITGLSLGWGLEEQKRPYVIVEKESNPGGLCRSVHLEVRGKGFFHFDLAGHVLHLRSPEIKTRLAPFLKRCGELERRAWIYMAGRPRPLWGAPRLRRGSPPAAGTSSGRLVPYPFQAHIAQLSPAMAEECLVGFLKAWVHPPSRRGASAGEAYPPTFDQWVTESFGEGIAKYFMRPYNKKLWTVPLDRMTCEWMGRFVPRPSVEDIAKGFITRQTTVMGYNPVFFYPKEGGIEALVKWMRGRLAPRNLHTGAEVVEVNPGRREVVLANGEHQPYERLFSTLPLPRLVKSIKASPPAVRQAARRLTCNSLMVLYLALDHPVESDRHWVYMPEEEFPFYRVGFPSNLTPHNAPAGCGSLLVECAVSRLEKVDVERWSTEVIEHLVKLGWIRSRASVLKHEAVRLPQAYVIFDRHRTKAVHVIQEYLKSVGIVSVGRYGAWEYSSIEDNIRTGLAVASK